MCIHMPYMYVLYTGTHAMIETVPSHRQAGTLASASKHQLFTLYSCSEGGRGDCVAGGCLGNSGEENYNQTKHTDDLSLPSPKRLGSSPCTFCT